MWSIGTSTDCRLTKNKSLIIDQLNELMHLRGVSPQLWAIDWRQIIGADEY